MGHRVHQRHIVTIFLLTGFAAATRYSDNWIWFNDLLYSFEPVGPVAHKTSLNMYIWIVIDHTSCKLPTCLPNHQD